MGQEQENMMNIEAALNRILNEGIPFTIIWDIESTGFLALGLFVALFLALSLWSVVQKTLL